VAGTAGEASLMDRLRAALVARGAAFVTLATLAGL